MISTLILGQQKFVLFVDNAGMEAHSDRTIQRFLEEHGQEKYVQKLHIPTRLDLSGTLKSAIDEEIIKITQKSNVILPPLSLLLCTYNSSAVFQLLQKLKKETNVRQCFLWATVKNIPEHFVIPFLEYMADLIVTLEDVRHLSILTRKPGGSVTNKFYNYQILNGQFSVRETKRVPDKPVETPVDPESLGTFKINLEEEELVARNALKLPYEKKSDEAKESNIIYTPDSDDDFDEEDPDEDLNI